MSRLFTIIYIFIVQYSVTVAMAMLLAESAVSLFFFLLFFKTCKHCNNMCPGCMSKGSQVKMDDDKSAKEYPEEKPCNELQGNKQHHDHEIRDLLHGIELIVRRGMVGIMISNHNAQTVEFCLPYGFLCELHRMV